MGGWASQYLYICIVKLNLLLNFLEGILSKRSLSLSLSLSHTRQGLNHSPTPQNQAPQKKEKEKNIPHRILLRIRPPLQPPRPKAINIRPRRLSRTEADLIRCQTHHTSIASMQIHHIIDRGTLDKMAHIRNARYGVDFGSRDVSEWVVDVGCIDEFGDEVGQGLYHLGVRR